MGDVAFEAATAIAVLGAAALVFTLAVLAFGALYGFLWHLVGPVQFGLLLAAGFAGIAWLLHRLERVTDRR